MSLPTISEVGRTCRCNSGSGVIPVSVTGNTMWEVPEGTSASQGELTRLGSLHFSGLWIGVRFKDKMVGGVWLAGRVTRRGGTQTPGSFEPGCVDVDRWSVGKLAMGWAKQDCVKFSGWNWVSSGMLGRFNESTWSKFWLEGVVPNVVVFETSTRTNSWGLRFRV